MTKINIALGLSLIVCALLLINSQYQARRLFVFYDLPDDLLCAHQVFLSDNVIKRLRSHPLR